MIKSISFIGLTYFFQFNQLKILRQPGYLLFFSKTNNFFFLQCDNHDEIPQYLKVFISDIVRLFYLQRRVSCTEYDGIITTIQWFRKLIKTQKSQAHLIFILRFSVCVKRKDTAIFDFAALISSHLTE